MNDNFNNCESELCLAHGKTHISRTNRPIFPFLDVLESFYFRLTFIYWRLSSNMRILAVITKSPSFRTISDFPGLLGQYRTVANFQYILKDFIVEWCVFIDVSKMLRVGVFSFKKSWIPDAEVLKSGFCPECYEGCIYAYSEDILTFLHILKSLLNFLCFISYL